MNQPRTPRDERGGDGRITRDDLEHRLRALQGDVEAVKESTIGVGVAAGGLVVVVLLVLVYVLGKRRGRKRYAFVEIRRV